MSTSTARVETGLKLDVPADFVLPDLGGSRLPSLAFTSTYMDTADRALARLGITLRRRLENGRNRWELDLPHGDSRLELEAPGGPRAVPEGLAEILLGIVRRRPLGPVSRLRTRRTGVRVERDDAALAAVTLDQIAVLDGRRVADRFQEVEIESLGGDHDTLDELTKLLCSVGAERSNGRPKVLRAAPLPPMEPPVPAPSRDAGLVRDALRARLTEVLRHDPGTRLGLDPEELHDFRVATRRLRAILRAARPLLERAWADEIRAELGWLGQTVGPVRDLDVLLEHLEAERAALPSAERDVAGDLFAELVAERTEARAAMLEALGDERYLRLLDRLEAEFGDPPFTTSGATLADLAAREFRRLRRAAREIAPDASDDELHAVRVQGKRARYTAELAEPVAGRPARRFVRRAKRFQDVVGEHQDAVVAAARLRGLVRRGTPPRQAFVAGILAERQEERRRAARAAYPRAWQKLDRAGRKAWA